MSNIKIANISLSKTSYYKHGRLYLPKVVPITDLTDKVLLPPPFQHKKENTQR